MHKKQDLPKGKNPEGKRRGKEPPGEQIRGNYKKSPQQENLYPIKDLEALRISSSDDDELDSSEAESLEEEAARYEEDRYHPREKEKSLRPPVVTSTEIIRQRQGPTAPPLTPPPYSLEGKANFISGEDQKKLRLTFPVFDNAEGGRVHAPVEYAQIKELAESVRNYGINANFTISQIERLATYHMTPGDWEIVTKAALPNMGQFLEWKALWHDLCQAQARINAAAEGPQRRWDFQLLTGQGPFLANQTQYDWGAYAQISAAAIKAWKALPRKGEAGGNLTKIIQGPNEPFSDFVARMTEAAGRIFGDLEQAMPLVERLVYEQATQECRAAITPRKNKGLQDWLRTCRELGGPLTNAGLAATILQGQKHPGQSRMRVCFKCGKPGHLRKDCKAQVPVREPGLCPRCKKGRHWANECKSQKDFQGNPLRPGMPSISQEIPKNGYSGPRTQGPQRYGPLRPNQAQVCEEQQREQQGWTSVPPPDSY